MRETARVESLWQSVREDLDLLAHARSRVVEAAQIKRRRAIDIVVSALAGAAIFGTLADAAGNFDDLIGFTPLPVDWQHSGGVFLAAIVLSGVIGLCGNWLKHRFVAGDKG